MSHPIIHIPHPLPPPRNAGRGFCGVVVQRHSRCTTTLILVPRSERGRGRGGLRFCKPSSPIVKFGMSHGKAERCPSLSLFTYFYLKEIRLTQLRCSAS